MKFFVMRLTRDEKTTYFILLCWPLPEHSSDFKKKHFYKDTHTHIHMLPHGYILLLVQH